MPTKLNEEVDWSKLFMGFAVALVFVLQAVNQMRVEQIKSTTLIEQEITDKIVKRVGTAKEELQKQIDVLKVSVKKLEDGI